MRLSTAVAVSLILIASTANAATYYVATSGNDAAAGSIDAPFRTISKAAQVVKPGDVVNVRGGVYTDRASIYSKGTAAAPIVFRAMPGETPILDGANTPSNKGVVELSETEYVDFSGFEIRNAPYIGIVLWHTRNTRVLDNHVHHTVRNGIYAGGDTIGSTSDVTVSGNSVHDTVLENQYHNMNGGGWAGAVVVSKADRATITSNRIWNNDGEGLISLRANGHLVQGNEIWDNFSVNLYLDNARFVTADRNLIYSTGNTRYYRNGLPAAGISIANETKDVMTPSSDNVFTNNIVIGTRWGFHYGNYESGGGLRNTRVLNNTFYGTIAEIVRIEDDAHANSVVANNIFHQTGSPAPRYGGGSAVSYANNVWYGGSAGAASGATDFYGDPAFVNPGGRGASDYRIALASIAAKNGVPAAAVATDFWGTPRAGVYDIGAHQLTSSVTVVPPAAPANVVAAPNTTSVVLTWTASANATSYRISRDGTHVATVAATSWTDGGLAPSTTYRYGVSAADASGNVSAETSASATTLPEVAADSIAPSAPIHLWAVPSTSAARVYLGWDAATDNVAVAGYRIYRNGTLVSTVTALEWTDDSGLPYATTFEYRVVAFDAAGNVSAAAIETATTIQDPASAADTQAPTTPANFWLVPSTSSTRMYLGWDPATDNVGVTGYRIYRDGVLVTTVNTTTWTDDSGLKRKTTYTYAVAAVDAAGNVSPQTKLSARTSK